VSILPRIQVQPSSADNHIFNLCRQGFHRERLGHDVHTVINLPMAQHGIVRIVRDEQHFQVGPSNSGRIGLL